jgi:uncharacterized protein YjbJ (UPF0337 family)
MWVRLAGPHREESDVAADDKTQNKTEGLVGKGKESLGKVTGDDEMKNEGKAEQSKADLKQAGEKVKDAFKKS